MKRLFILPAVLFALVLSGCNVLGGEAPGSSNDPEVLMTDAQQAMEQGEPAKAVEYLEKAIAKSTPNSKQWVQAHLQIVSAELSAANITVLDLQNLVDDLNTKVEGASGKSGAFLGFAGQVCSYESGDHALETVNLGQLAGWAKFASSLQSFERIQEWIDDVVELQGHGVMTEESFRNALNQAVGQYEGNPQVLALLQAGLLSYSVAQFAIAYNEIVEAGGTEITWYRVQSAAGGYYLGYCAPSQQVIDQARQQTACSMKRISHMIDVLKVRASLFPSISASTQEFIDKVQAGYDKLKVELDGVCSVTG